ncbi:ATP-binding protein [Streptomyces sp. SID8364]|nr:ATP-binding protein [Streptomyces sp. SID8364]
MPFSHESVDLRGCETPQRATRQLVRGALAEVPADYRDDVVLVADELVGNALEHGGEAVSVSLGRYAWGAVVVVRDGCGDLAAVPCHPAAAADDDVNGRGLFLVNMLASAWHVQSDGVGKRGVAVFLHGAGDTR